jgi:hypothetical protein
MLPDSNHQPAARFQGGVDATVARDVSVEFLLPIAGIEERVRSVNRTSMPIATIHKDRQWSWIFFVSFILVAAFVVINVFIAIVLNSMEEARELERRPPIGADEVAPVAERIAILRNALDELERELHVRDLK